MTPPAERGGNWTKPIHYTFPGFLHDAIGPDAEITFDSQGNVYGTSAGGTTGYGTVFLLTPPNGSGSWKETVLHDFTGASDGGYPGGTVTLGANGVL